MSEERVEFKFDMKLEPGNPTILADLTPEDKSLLVELNNSRSWKLYSKMLSVYATGMLNSLLPMEDPIKITKNLGIVAGCNFAINSLGIQVSQFKKQAEMLEAKRVAEESKNQPKPRR